MSRILQPLRLSTAVVFTVVLLALVAPHASGLRLVVGLPLVLLLPGRALVMAFDPRHKLGSVERFAVAIALSFCLVIVLGMVLAVSPLGLTMGGCVMALSAVTLIAEAIALHRHTEEALDVGFPLRSETLRKPAFIVALSLIAVALVTGTVLRNAAFRPSSGELVQLWMLPDETRNDGGVEIGVEKKISEASKFNLQYYQGSASASDTPVIMRAGTSMVFTRAPLVETTSTAPPIGARLEALGGRTRSRTVSWWPR